MHIKDWQVEVDTWIKEVGVRYFDPKTNTILLMEEVGELARHIARVHGEQSYKGKKEANTKTDYIKEEIADIFFVLTCLANQPNISLEEALSDTINKKTNRDKKRHQDNQKLR